MATARNGSRAWRRDRVTARIRSSPPPASVSSPRRPSAATNSRSSRPRTNTYPSWRTRARSAVSVAEQRRGVDQLCAGGPQSHRRMVDPRCEGTHAPHQESVTGDAQRAKRCQPTHMTPSTSTTRRTGPVGEAGQYLDAAWRTEPRREARHEGDDDDAERDPDGVGKRGGGHGRDRAAEPNHRPPQAQPAEEDHELEAVVAVDGVEHGAQRRVVSTAARARDSLTSSHATTAAKATSQGHGAGRLAGLGAPWPVRRPARDRRRRPERRRGWPSSGRPAR